MGVRSRNTSRGGATTRVPSSLSYSLELALSLLSPPRCAGCDAHVPILTAFCPACAPSIETSASGRAVFVYGGAMATAIARFKYGARSDLARPLGALLAQSARHLRGEFDVVVPVPLHSSRLVERGYNQSALLARHVAKMLGIPHCPRGLTRVRPTAAQVALRREARETNVLGAFVVRCPRALASRRVLLIDDVRTTGATLEACSVAARSAGALEVRCWALAEANAQS